MKLPTHSISFTKIHHWSDWIAWAIVALIGGWLLACIALNYMGPVGLS
jgi:uncharacterized membrane protein YdfJ with MMPL/SSD domain